MYHNDTNICNIVLSSGTTAYSLSLDQCLNQSTPTNVINSTNGLTIGTPLIMQYAANGLDYTNYVQSYGNSGTAALDECQQVCAHQLHDQPTGFTVKARLASLRPT